MMPENYDWEAAWTAKDRPANVLPHPTITNGSGATPYGASPYGMKALETELQTLASTTEGSRNHQLNVSAFNLAQLVASGHLDHHTTMQQLRDVAIAIGLTATEVEATLKSGFNDGLKNPRIVPEKPSLNVLEVPTIDPKTGVIMQPAPYQYTPGGSFILDTDPEPKALWGEGESVMWADGEALIIAAPQGVGKTTTAQQITLGRCGFDDYLNFLGYPIEPGQNRVLYLAMDRPRQAARSFRRMVGEPLRRKLDERLSVWQGPPPLDLAKHPSILLDLCEKAEADTVIIDSIKDAALGLSDDEVGASYNRARQHAITAGVQVLELHHIRKALSGAKAEHPNLDDLYGSTWITSGAGSVILLNGKPGDPIVNLHHLKQPASEVGPLKVIHDHDTGRTTIWHQTDLLLLARQVGGLTAVDAARALFDTEKPTPNEKEKARRKLMALTDQDLLWMFDKGDKATQRPAKWSAK